MLLSLQFPLWVGCGNARSRPALRAVRGPGESPAERAERFRKLLESGEFASQSELARALGCSQPWISRVLSKASKPGAPTP